MKRMSPAAYGALQRMDPAELLETLFQQGSHLSRMPHESRDDWEERTMKVIMAGAHKARVAYGASVFTLTEVNDSIRWLHSNGFKTGRPQYDG